MKSWRAPYSSCICPSASVALTSVDGAEEKGYEHLPPLDESVAAHLCPPTAIGWKARASHSSKPCRATSTLAGHAYSGLLKLTCNSDVSVLLSFLQEMLDKQRFSSTIKGYVAAIAAFHAPIAGRLLGRDVIGLEIGFSWWGKKWYSHTNIDISTQYSFLYRIKIKSNQVIFIVTSPQHMCLSEWNSWEHTPDIEKTIYIKTVHT